MTQTFECRKQNTITTCLTKCQNRRKKINFIFLSYNFNLRPQYNDIVAQRLTHFMQKKVSTNDVRSKMNCVRPCRHFMQENNGFYQKIKRNQKNTLIAGCYLVINYYDSHFHKMISNGVFDTISFFLNETPKSGDFDRYLNNVCQNNRPLLFFHICFGANVL